MKKLLLILIILSSLSVISCGEDSSVQTTQSIELNKQFNTSAKKVEAFGYWVSIWKVKVDSIEYTIGTTSSHAPITVMDKQIIRKKKKR